MKGVSTGAKLFGWGGSKLQRKKLRLSKRQFFDAVQKATVKELTTQAVTTKDFTFDVKTFNTNIKKAVGNFTLLQLLTDGGVPVDKEGELYQIVNVLKLDHIFQMFDIKTQIQTYLTNVYQPKALVDQAAKDSQSKQLLASMISFANNFDPTGITGIVASFMHDDCPQFDPTEPEEQIVPPPVPPPEAGKPVPFYVPINPPASNPIMQPLQPPQPYVYQQSFGSSGFGQPAPGFGSSGFGQPAPGFGSSGFGQPAPGFGSASGFGQSKWKKDKTNAL